MHNPTAAAIYVRISQDKTGAGLGVERQEAECRELARRKGWDVAQVYADNDISASDLTKRRPAYEAMLAAVEAGDIDGIICWHTDRLTRQPQQLEDIILLAEKHGIGLGTVQGDIDLGTPNGKMVARMLGAAARQEVEQKSERQKARNRQAAHAGLPPGGGRRFGFENDGRTHRPAEAEALRDATRRVIEGGSLASIMREWNAAGLLTTRGRPWGYTSMTAVLKRWSNAAIVEFKGEALEGVSAQWEPIVSPDELRAVRSILSNPARRTNSGGTAVKHVLSGIIRCDVCGSAMRWGKTRTRAGLEYENYVCKNGLNKCRRAVSKDVAEEVVTAHVAQRLTLPGPDLAETTAADREEATRLRRERAGLDDDEASWMKANVSTRARIEALEGIEDRRATLDRLIERLTERNVLAALMSDLTKMSKGSTLPIDAVRAAREGVKERFNSLDIHQRRAIIRALMTVRVTKHPAGVRPTMATAAQRVVITPLDPRTGEPLDDSYDYDLQSVGEAGQPPA